MLLLLSSRMFSTGRSSLYLFFHLPIYGLSFPVCWLTNNGDRTELSQSDLFNHEYDYRLISTTRSSVTNLWYFSFLKIKIQEIPRDFLARREIKAINWVRAMARTVLLHCSITYRNQNSWKPIRFENFVIVMMGKLKKAVILSDKDIAKLIKTYSEYVFRLTFIPV